MPRLEYTSNIVDSLRGSGPAHQRKFEANGAKILKLLLHGSSLQAGTPYGEAQVGFPENVRDSRSNRGGVQGQDGARPLCDFMSFFGDQFLITDAGRNIEKNGLFAWEFTQNKLNQANFQNYFSSKINNYLEVIDSEHRIQNRDKFYPVEKIRQAAQYHVQLRNGGQNQAIVYDQTVQPPAFCTPNRQAGMEWNLFFVISSQTNATTKQKLEDFVTYMELNHRHDWDVSPITHRIPGQQAPGNYPGALEFEYTGGGQLPKLRVGFITSNSFIDLSAEIEEICKPNRGIADGIKRRQFLSRCLGIMTGDAFSPENARFLHEMHAHLPNMSQGGGDFTSVKNQGNVTFSNGATATKYSITNVNQKLLAQLSMVPRTLRNPEALQRPPNWKHLSGMSESIVAGKSFALPVIAITDSSTRINDGNQAQRITPHGFNFMVPNNWEIVDGQHRVYSYFALPDQQANIGLDLQLLVFNANVTLQARREAAAELFFDINHRALEPDKVHAIAHYSRFDDFENGWRFKNAEGPQNDKVNGDKATWSSRLMAGKFIIELNQTNNSPFEGLFDVHGIDSTKIPLSSVTQYLSCFFEFGRIWSVNRQNQNVTKLKGKYSIYRKFQIQNQNNQQIFPTDLDWEGFDEGPHEYRGPSPRSTGMQYFWPELINQFQLFLTRTGLNDNQITEIFSDSSDKSARLPAVFSLFVWYTCQEPQNANIPAGDPTFSFLSLDPVHNQEVNALSHLGTALQDPQTWNNLPTGSAAVATIAGKLYNRYCEECTNAGDAFHRFGPSPNGIFDVNGGPAGNDDYKKVKWIINPK